MAVDFKERARKAQEWQENRLAYLRALKNPSDHQRLLLIIADMPTPTSEDKRKFDALLQAERAAERAEKLRGVAAKIVDADKKAERKARDHELYNAAGLLILAGLVDTKTGAPKGDRAELLGALCGLSKVPPDDHRRSEWKRAGDALLAAESQKKGSRKKEGGSDPASVDTSSPGNLNVSSNT